MGVKVRNARKSFNFRVGIAGVDQYLVQNVTLPEKSIEAVEHGDTNHNIGTPGKISWSDLELDKLLPASLPDNTMWNWCETAQSDIAGGGLPAQYERIIQLDELSPDGVTTLNTYLITCWPKVVKYGKHSRVDAAENVLESVTFHVNRFQRI